MSIPVGATHHFVFRVYFEDTDAMGIIYHANYLNIFERSRTEMLRSYGLSLTTMAKYGTHFAIHQANLVYHHPGRLDDSLTVTTVCQNKTACRVVFQQTMHNQLGQLLCEAMIVVVALNEQYKPKRLPKDI